MQHLTKCILSQLMVSVEPADVPQQLLARPGINKRMHHSTAALNKADAAQLALTHTTHREAWVYLRPSISCILTSCHKVYNEMIHDSTRTTIPAGHPKYDMAEGSPNTPAPTIAVTLWKAEYHLQGGSLQIVFCLCSDPACLVRATSAFGNRGSRMQYLSVV